ncbi:MAG: baseplate J/gp47 family protein [Muribaculum sp.]|nr:baseplate J/gp47 family protein [Muribaculum sp.]
MSDIKYPDIEFLETDTETVISNMIALYEETQRAAGRENYQVRPASPERIFISWMAAIIVQQRTLINDIAKMNVPRYAAKSENEDYLDSLAEIFKDTPRNPAVPASATFRFYISEPQKQSTIIPAGTRISFDGVIIFATSEVLEIKAGETSGDVEAVCTQPGTVGNGLAAGQVKEVVDLFDHYQKAENITTTSGGAEKEDNESYYERMRDSMESFSTAGPINGYIYWTKSVSSAVLDVAVTSPEACVVDVRVILRDGQEATPTVLKDIEEALNASDIRPLTDVVTVSAPDTVDFSVDATFYIAQPNRESAAAIEREVRAAVDSFIVWQTSKMGRDINPSQLTKMMMDAGAKRVEVRQPTFQSVADIAVGKLQSKTVLNGGLEDV